MFRIKVMCFSFFFLLICFEGFSQANDPPILNANGRQAFCPNSQINIVTDFSISDTDDTEIDAFYVQISSGYQINQDQLILLGSHPTINTAWNNTEGKLSLTGIGANKILYPDLEKAIKDIVFQTTATTITEEKFFSLTIGDANYLPSTDHYYEYVDDLSITWSDAKDAAANRTYFGLKGYLATLLSSEEAQLAGEQASGAGWIGGSDEETEGVWKWVTGPEAGTVFWNGAANGSSPNYANWNNNEPNDFRGNNPGGEDYAHITDPSIGIRGAWNDLPNPGDAPGPYHPKGYIVEYGGSIGDPILNISVSTSIYLPKILGTNGETICGSGITTISATPSEGTILWYDALTGGNLLDTGTNFTTTVNTSTTYYATVSVNGCTSIERTPVNVTVQQRPTITANIDNLICSAPEVLSATASAGVIYWYDSPTSTKPLYTGDNYEISITSDTKYFVEANDSGCVSLNRTEINAIVGDGTPEFDVDQEIYILCKDEGSITLNTINEQGNYTYLWEKDGVLISGITSSIEVDRAGTYTVQAFSQIGCASDIKTIQVIVSEAATITKDDVTVIEDSNNNSIRITNPNLGIGDYEYALNDGNYQDEPFFDNLSGGTHVLYINDKNGCGTTPYLFTILQYPKFFTPNNDGENDQWHIKGYDNNFYVNSSIYIYNRFGKIISIINTNSDGWDGKYQGIKLPADSYWFKVILANIDGTTTEKKGAFSLIRR